MLGLGLNFDAIFSLLMLPAFIAAAAILFKGVRYSAAIRKATLATL